MTPPLGGAFKSKAPPFLFALIHTISFSYENRASADWAPNWPEIRLFLPRFYPLGTPRDSCGFYPHEAPSLGSKSISPLNNQSLHLRLRLFSQPKERFSLRKKFNKSHKCSRAAKALAEAQPCTSLWGRRTQTDARLEAPSYEDFIPLRGCWWGANFCR